MNIKVLGLLAFTWSIGCGGIYPNYTVECSLPDSGEDSAKDASEDSSDAGIVPIFYWDSTADYYMNPVDSNPPDMCCNVFYQDACVVPCPNAD